MPHDIVAVTEANFAELHRVVESAFGGESTAERVQDELLTAELDRFFGVADGGRLVASGGAYTFELTVPGGVQVPAAGVTWIGVLPSHRRRGILTAMMRHQLDDVAERGEPVAVLTASEAVIYSRYGYGVASRYQQAEIPTSRSSFRTPPAVAGSTRLVWDDEVVATVAPIHDAWRRVRPGSVDRNEGYWAMLRLERDWQKSGASTLFWAVHQDGDGTDDGYAAYRVKQGDNDGENRVWVDDVCALDPEVEIALWRFLLDLDLTVSVRGNLRPVDDHLPWRLTDSRAYQVTAAGDFLWARLVDVPAALSARRYERDGAVTLEVDDPFTPAWGGRFRVEGGPDGAACKRLDAAGEEADVRLSTDALGSAYLGTVSFATLARAGRAAGTPEALRRADDLFATTVAPYCITGF